MIKRTLSLTESVAFELDNLAAESNCDLETLISNNLSKVNNCYGKKTIVLKPPCYMCDNARVNDDLTDEDDLSYITVGKCDMV